jgi:hypothetical protein
MDWQFIDYTQSKALPSTNRSGLSLNWGSTMTEEPLHTFDQAVLSAWHDELQATRNLSLKQQLSHREGELLPRFIEHYQQLKTLRRRVRRSLQRQWKRSLAGVALLIALGQAPALAAAINVSGTCTLVRAIVAANLGTTAGGNCVKGSGPDTLVLSSGSTRTLTAVNNTVYGDTGLPVIRGVITINGNGSTLSRGINAPSFRIFAVGETGDLTLQRTTVSGGEAFDSNLAIGNKGGILTLNNSPVSGNTGCGIDNSYFNNRYNYSGRANVNSSLISGNAGCGI